MDIEIDIFIVHWVLTLNSHYGTKLGQTGFFAVQPLGEIRPKRLSIAVFAETELARYGGLVESLLERRIVRWCKSGVLCMRKTEEIHQAIKRLVVGMYAGSEMQNNNDLPFLRQSELSALFVQMEDQKPEDDVA